MLLYTNKMLGNGTHCLQNFLLFCLKVLFLIWTQLIFCFENLKNESRINKTFIEALNVFLRVPHSNMCEIISYSFNPKVLWGSQKIIYSFWAHFGMPLVEPKSVMELQPTSLGSKILTSKVVQSLEISSNLNLKQSYESPIRVLPHIGWIKK